MARQTTGGETPKKYFRADPTNWTLAIDKARRLTDSRPGERMITVSTFMQLELERLANETDKETLIRLGLVGEDA